MTCLEHFGVHHYVIHGFEGSSFAKDAWPSCRRSQTSKGDGSGASRENRSGIITTTHGKLMDGLDLLKKLEKELIEIVKLPDVNARLPQIRDLLHHGAPGYHLYIMNRAKSALALAAGGLSCPLPQPQTFCAVSTTSCFRSSARPRPVLRRSKSRRRRSPSVPRARKRRC